MAYTIPLIALQVTYQYVGDVRVSPNYGSLYYCKRDASADWTTLSATTELSTGNVQRTFWVFFLPVFLSHNCNHFIRLIKDFLMLN